MPAGVGVKLYNSKVLGHKKGILSQMVASAPNHEEPIRESLNFLGQEPRRQGVPALSPQSRFERLFQEASAVAGYAQEPRFYDARDLPSHALWQAQTPLAPAELRQASLPAAPRGWKELIAPYVGSGVATPSPFTPVIPGRARWFHSLRQDDRSVSLSALFEELGRPYRLLAGLEAATPSPAVVEPQEGSSTLETGSSPFTDSYVEDGVSTLFSPVRALGRFATSLAGQYSLLLNLIAHPLVSQYVRSMETVVLTVKQFVESAPLER